MDGLTNLLLLLCVGVTVSTVLDLQKRIEGGKDCQRQFHVKILDGNNNFICGGSLLKNNWILTAAHCKESPIRVVLGAHLGPGRSTLMEIKKDPVTYADDHDIMLLKLPNPTMIQHVDLPDCVSEDPPKKDEKVQVAGYEGSNTQALKCADMAVTPCLVDDDHPVPKKYMFCGLAKGVRMCGGDSGGGVLYKGQIYGVHKSSVKNRGVCAPEAGFMNVCKYKAWIKEKTGIQ